MGIFALIILCPLVAISHQTQNAILFVALLTQLHCFEFVAMTAEILRVFTLHSWISSGTLVCKPR